MKFAVATFLAFASATVAVDGIDSGSAPGNIRGTPKLKEKRKAKQHNWSSAAHPRSKRVDAVAKSVCIAEFSQCGGKNFETSSECCDGLSCLESNEHWHYCFKEVSDHSIHFRISNVVLISMAYVKV